MPPPRSELALDSARRQATSRGSPAQKPLQPCSGNQHADGPPTDALLECALHERDEFRRRCTELVTENATLRAEAQRCSELEALVEAMREDNLRLRAMLRATAVDDEAGSSAYSYGIAHVTTWAPPHAAAGVDDSDDDEQWLSDGCEDKENCAPDSGELAKRLPPLKAEDEWRVFRVLSERPMCALLVLHAHAENRNSRGASPTTPTTAFCMLPTPLPSHVRLVMPCAVRPNAVRPTSAPPARLSSPPVCVQI